jgi:hypothetical protein
MGYQRLMERYVVHTIVHMIHGLFKKVWTDEKRIRFGRLFKSVFRSGDYLTYPSPSQWQSAFLALWGSDGPQCLASSKHTLFQQMSLVSAASSSRSQVALHNRSDYLPHILGHTLKSRMMYKP